MNIRDRKALKQEALTRLSDLSGQPRKLVLIHTAIALGSALLVALLSFLLQEKIDTTGGLSGIGLRTWLTTAQSLLQVVQMLLLPFWEIGILYVAVRFARSQASTIRDLTAGFRLFGPVLRLKLGQIFVYGSLVMPCAFIAAGIFTMTPWSADYVALMMPYVEQMMATGEQVVLDVAAQEEILMSMYPAIFIFLGVYLLTLLPIYYRLRMTDYIIMDGKTRSGLFAMLASWQMTRGEGFRLFLLDLSFWWFYGLNALAVLIAYGDTILSLLGVELPIPAEGVYFLFYGAYILAQCLLYWGFGSYMHTTYALAYESLKDRAKIPVLQIIPANPWTPDEN